MSVLNMFKVKNEIFCTVGLYGKKPKIILQKGKKSRRMHCEILRKFIIVSKYSCEYSIFNIKEMQFMIGCKATVSSR